MKNEKCGFKCTGADFSHVWNIIHDPKGPILSKIDCESCNQHAQELFKFIHDMVNLGLGKKAFDIKNYNKILGQANCVVKHGL